MFNQVKQKEYDYQYWWPTRDEHPMKWHHYDPEHAILILSRTRRWETEFNEGAAYSPVSSMASDDAFAECLRSATAPRIPSPQPQACQYSPVTGNTPRSDDGLVPS